MTRIDVKRGSGKIAVEVHGEGPLVLCVPGMGECRASFRHLLRGLVEAGYRVAVMDLRGHGDSSVDFDSYDNVAAASDILAVIDELGGTAVAVIGNSMGASAAVLAAHDSEAIASLVLIGPFLRDAGSKAGLMRLLLAKPWGPTVWKMFYKSLFGEVCVDDHDAHVAHALGQLQRPGRWKAFQQTAQTSHSQTAAVLPQVVTPALIVMGEKDKDFPDPEAEAKWGAESLRGKYVMIPGGGHYPQSEDPDAVIEHVLPFLKGSRG